MHVQFRRGTADQWSAYNPVLSLGEPGFEVDTHQLKIGNGSTAWIDLPYVVLDANTMISRTKLVLSPTQPAHTPGTVWIQRDAVPGVDTTPPPPLPPSFAGTVTLSDAGVLSNSGSALAGPLLPSNTLTPSETLLPNG